MTITSFRGKHAFLSNFYASPITVAGIRFPTVEHAFQAAKVTLDYPHVQRRQLQVKIASLSSAADAKRFGKTITLRADWMEVRVGVMRSLLRMKFDLLHLSKMLMATDPHELVEGNEWNDVFWGVCRSKGHNILGKLLMERRELLIDEHMPADSSTRQALALHDAA